MAFKPTASVDTGLASGPRCCGGATQLTLGEECGGIAGCLRKIVAEEGCRGLYRGLGPTLYAVGPFVGIQLATVDMIKASCAATNTALSTPVLLGTGAAAGAAAQTVVYPLDVLRRRMQIGGEARARCAPARTAPAWRRLGRKHDGARLHVSPR